MSGRPVKLVFISDFTCPWCYIGYRELQRAIQQTPELSFSYDIEVRPFMLAASQNQPAGADKEDVMVKKFGRERWEGCKKMVCQKGEEVGITFSMSGPLSQTLLAHRLMAKTYLVGGSAAQQRLLPALFRSYHEMEMDIGSEDILAELAEQEGILSREETLQFLRSDELAAKVEAQVNEARAKGVTGVPFTIIDGRWAVSGGQPAPVFVQIFNKLAQSCCDNGHVQDAPTPKASNVGCDNMQCNDVAAAA